MDLTNITKLENKFDPGNEVEILYEDLIGNSLEDCNIALDCLERLSDYIDYLEGYIEMIHADCPPFGLEAKDIRRKYEKSRL